MSTDCEKLKQPPLGSENFHLISRGSTVLVSQPAGPRITCAVAAQPAWHCRRHPARRTHAGDRHLRGQRLGHELDGHRDGSAEKSQQPSKRVAYAEPDTPRTSLDRRTNDFAHMGILPSKKGRELSESGGLTVKNSLICAERLLAAAGAAIRNGGTRACPRQKTGLGAAAALRGLSRRRTVGSKPQLVAHFGRALGYKASS